MTWLTVTEHHWSHVDFKCGLNTLVLVIHVDQSKACTIQYNSRSMQDNDEGTWHSDTEYEEIPADQKEDSQVI